jgi:hypothetical protein
MILRINSCVISLNNFNRLIVVVETGCVFFEVRTAFLNIIVQLNNCWLPVNIKHLNTS